MLAVDGTYNVRRAGGAAWLYRSAALDALSGHGLDTLRSAGVGLVIDLRENCERGAASIGLPNTHIPIYGLPDGPPRTDTLAAVYRLMVFERGRELTAAVAEIARADSAVLVHCTAGKDRTGLVVALALLAAGSDDQSVFDDYAASGEAVAVHRVVCELRERFGSVGDYLLAHGMTDDELLRLQGRPKLTTHA